MNSATVVRFASALEITTDELLQPNSAQTPLRRRPSLCVLRRSERIERLPLHQQDTLLKTIDGFLKRRCKLTANTPRTQHEQGRTVFDFIRVMFDVIGSRHPLGARHRALREDGHGDDSRMRGKSQKPIYDTENCDQPASVIACTLFVG
jgi:hypothetical protein